MFIMTALLVTGRNAGMSEAQKTPLPFTPKTNGLSFLAQTILSGSLLRLWRGRRSLQAFEAFLNCADKSEFGIVFESLLDKVWHHFGVCFRNKCVVEILEFSFEFHEVFDDSVVNNHYFACAVGVRVRVNF